MLAASWLCVALASAQEIPENDRDAARKLMAQGRREEGLGNFVAAGESYGKAYRLTGAPTAGTRYAAALAGAGTLLKAREIARKVAGTLARPGEPAVFPAARTEAAELAEGLDRRMPKLRIVGKSLVSLELDGRDVGSDKPIEVDPGPHTAKAKLDGEAVSKTVTALEGREVRVEFEPKVTPTGPGPAPVEPEEQEVQPRTVLIYAGAIVGGVGLLAGATSSTLAFLHAKGASDYCTNNICGEKARPFVERVKTYGTLANISFIVMGVGSVALLTGLFYPKAPTKKVSPELGLGWIGITGSFQ
jgi:hypothetical protein